MSSGIFVLDASDLRGMSDYLRGLGWLGSREEILEAERAGEGNMNCTLRVRTCRRTFILKQARDWVEKYPHIAAPSDRAVVEAGFYELVTTRTDLAAYMPKLIGFDEQARMLCLEDLGEAQDYTSIYADGNIAAADLRTLLQFVSALHAAFRAYSNRAAFSNTAMRELNHQHIFVIPLLAENGLKLDGITPGLGDAASTLKSDVGYREEVLALGRLYLSEGDCLLHGDYFPGSWLNTSAGIKVIDPEFCFFGPPEFDLGVMLAHLLLAGFDRTARNEIRKLYGSPVDEELMVRFAGVEIMRRLIGVAQLPLKIDLPGKRRLLEKSREMVLCSGTL
jgi:5-methylthioribose kinase